MKFTDGNWMMREGVRPYYPVEAYRVLLGDATLDIDAPTSRVHNRGCTLGGPLLSVRLSSPMNDCIRVTVSHFSGAVQPGPRFELHTSPAYVIVEDDGNFASLTSGRLAAKIRKSAEWGIEFEAGERSVTRSAARGIGYMQVEGEGPYMHEQLSLGVGEYVYGLGERFTSLIKNGQIVEIWNKDGGTGSDQAYKNVPFYLTNRGYGVFVNHPENVSFEVASEKVSRVQFSVAGEALDYFVIYGPTPKEVLSKYTALTGRPALVPAWTFGLWLTTSFTTNYDEQTVNGILDEMRSRDLPLSVFHFDCFWMREFHWCDFEWDPRTFPDPAGMLGRLKERGLHICVWINPYMAQLSTLFDDAKSGGYLIKKPNGDVWQTDQWQPGMGIVDFTNPEACQWYAGHLRRLLEMGVDCFKTDFGERIPIDVVYHDGSDPEKMHNYYSVLYNQTVFDLLEQQRGKGEAALFARSASASSQRFPVHWGGDCYSSFESMAESLRGGLSLGMSGFGFWSHDIGGFEGTPPAAVYKRWIQFGLLSSHSRLHGSSSYRVPWVYDEEAVDVLRYFTRLKCSLMPYLFAAAVEASRTGIPMMRSMMLEFPTDPTCELLDRQYMLGDSLLVAPVFSESDVTFYIPEGRWTNYLSGAVIEGPGWVTESHGFMSLPLLVRPNSVIPVGAVQDRPDYDFADGVTLQVYELEDAKSVMLTIEVETQVGEVPTTYTVTRSGNRIDIASIGESQSFRVLLVGTQSISSVDGGEAQVTPHGMLIDATEGAVAIGL